MEEQKKEIFIGEIRTHLSNAGEVKHEKRSIARRFYTRVGAPGVALLISTTLVLGVLGGYYWSFLQVEMTGTTTLHGSEVTSVFTWDDTPILGELAVPLSVADMYPNDTISETHTIRNCDLGSWLISFNDSTLQDIYNNPLNAYYGYNISMTPNGFILNPFEEMNVTITQYLHYEYLDPSLYNASNDLPVSVSVDIEAVTPPMANPDTLSYPYGGYGTIQIDVLNNDMSYAVDPELSIISTEWIGPSDGITLTIVTLSGHDAIQLNNWQGVPGTHVFSYTIQDTNGLEDTATVTLN